MNRRIFLPSLVIAPQPTQMYIEKKIFPIKTADLDKKCPTYLLNGYFSNPPQTEPNEM